MSVDWERTSTRPRPRPQLAIRGSSYEARVAPRVNPGQAARPRAKKEPSKNRSIFVAKKNKKKKNKRRGHRRTMTRWCKSEDRPQEECIKIAGRSKPASLFLSTVNFFLFFQVCSSFTFLKSSWLEQVRSQCHWVSEWGLHPAKISFWNMAVTSSYLLTVGRLTMFLNRLWDWTPLNRFLAVNKPSTR
jgi:hypothetical protein